MFLRTRILKILLILAPGLSLSSALKADAMSDYAKTCDDYIGASVPQFSCLQGTEIPIDGPENGPCKNPSNLNGKCWSHGRVGKLATRNPDVEIRFLCRHYEKSSGPNDPIFNDIAVIQYNTKTGATCFYQSPSGSTQKLNGTVVPAPILGDNAVLQMSNTGGCVSCHDNRGFIKTSFFKGVQTPDQIPMPSNFGEYFTPGKPFENVTAYKVKAANDPSCSLCHNMGASPGSTISGTSIDLGMRASRQASSNNLIPGTVAWMGDGSGFGTNSSAAAHKKCALDFAQGNGISAGCSITMFRPASSFPRPNPNPSPSPTSCNANQWFSAQYNRCFEKNGACQQYSNTDTATCETPNDSLACDWDNNKKTCFDEPKKVTCNGNQWFSPELNRCFEKAGKCSQYSSTNQSTCETGNDSLACDWDNNKKTCFDEPKKVTCNGNQWFSPELNRCFEKNGKCEQYNNTNLKTCESSEDTLHCDYDDKKKVCFPEKK